MFEGFPHPGLAAAIAGRQPPDERGSPLTIAAAVFPSGGGLHACTCTCASLLFSLFSEQVAVTHSSRSELEKLLGKQTHSSPSVSLRQPLSSSPPLLHSALPPAPDQILFTFQTLFCSSTSPHLHPPKPPTPTCWFFCCYLGLRWTPLAGIALKNSVLPAAAAAEEEEGEILRRAIRLE